MNLFKIIFIFFSLVFILANPVYAYIDPGTGSFILQSLLAIGATIVVYLGYPIRAIKVFFKNLKEKKNKKDKVD